jgi:hypothetical protein
MIFQNFFRGKFNFSQHFWGKIFCGIFPGKNARKIGPELLGRLLKRQSCKTYKSANSVVRFENKNKSTLKNALASKLPV